MIRIEFNVRPVLNRLARAKAALDDLSPVFEDIAEYEGKATRDRFPAGVGPDGRRWRAKSPTTLAGYLRRGDGARPHPLIGPSGRLGREIRQVATRDYAEIGSNLIQAAVMQFGAKRGAFGTSKAGRPLPWGDIPARPFLGISADDERTILQIVDNHLGEAIGDD